MTAQDYTQTCQVCDKKYMPTLRKCGKPMKTKHRLCSTACRSKSKRPISPSRVTPKAKITRKCPQCGVLFCRYPGKSTRFCSLSCSYSYQCGKYKPTPRVAIAKDCVVCGIAFESMQPWTITCGKECQMKRKYSLPSRVEGDRRRDARRRAAKVTTQTEYISPTLVFDRDKWLCHLCGVKTLRSLRGTYEDRAPELEHIISLSDGGTHTWGNVACSCRKCNSTKGAASLGQLGFDMAV